MTTPQEINAWVAPLWKARPECRPTDVHGVLTLLSEVKDTETGDTGGEHWCYFGGTNSMFVLCNNDETATERIEWHIDRFLESWASGLLTFHSTSVVVGRDDSGGWYVAVYDFGTKLILKKANHKDRLAAKLKLAYDATGVEPPKELNDG